MSKPRIAFGWYGGKHHHLPFLTQSMPSDMTHFVDVFGGGGHVVLNAPDNFKYRVYNDIDGEVVNFFQVLRDNPYELIDRISLTPYARDELADACASPPGPDSLCAVERARRHDDGSGERLI